MDFLGEYEELKVLKNHTLVSWQFFELFKVEEDDDGKYLVYMDTKSRCLSDDEYGAFKAFLKAQRSALRKEALPVGECSKRIWFWYSKLLELNMFTLEIRSEILKWMEVGQLIMT